MGYLVRKLTDESIYLIKLVHPINKDDSLHLLTKLNEIAQSIAYEESFLLVLDTSQIPADKFQMLRFINMLSKFHSKWYTTIKLELGIIATSWHLPSIKVITRTSFVPFAIYEDLSELTSTIYQKYGQTKLLDLDESDSA